MASKRIQKRNHKSKMPIGVFKVDRELTPQETEEIKKQITEAFGARNRFLVVADDVNYIPFDRRRSNKIFQLRSLKHNLLKQ